MLMGSWVAALYPQTFVWEGGADSELFEQLAFPLDSLTGGLEQRAVAWHTFRLLSISFGCYPSPLADTPSTAPTHVT